MDSNSGLGREDAVIPIVGVVLLIAITVILMAAISVFVFDVTGTVEPTPDADFSFTYDGGSLNVTHQGGSPIDGERLYIRGDNIDASVNGNTWVDNIPSHSRVITGHTISFSADSDYVVRIVYEDQESSETLAIGRGPDF